jgi:hypothetical protein
MIYLIPLMTDYTNLNIWKFFKKSAMGGNAGIRGYIVQTIIGMIDALEKDNSWQSVTLEPVDESEKVDIRWRYPNKTKFSQVKSSQNIIKLYQTKKWCKELKDHSPGADEYELIIVGHPEDKLLKEKKIDDVTIAEFKTLNIDSLIAEASTKIDTYYEKKNKPKISSKVREILVKNLATHFGTNSIIGKEITRSEFDKDLLEWISAIEKQIDTNPFASLAPPVENINKEINHRIAEKIIELIGWDKFNENPTIEIFNERTGENDKHTINFFGDIESKLKEATDDFIMITSLHDLNYPESSKNQIQKYLNDTDKVFDDLKQKKKIPITRNNNTDYHSILFWLTTENSELWTDFIYRAKENYKRDLLADDITYYLVDNNRANFLISSIGTAKNYREDLAVKFLYPITEANQKPGSIGQRGFKLPVQYINTSVLPIIKEDSSAISILLFCSDSFSSETLKKLIWLTIRLTSGLGNEYLIYFSDYDIAINQNEANEVIRSFNDEILQKKLRICRYISIDAKALDALPLVKAKNISDEIYDESKESTSTKHLNEAFISILPYGDILKPFLTTDAITAQDLRIFLAKKGIFIKNADRSKLINVMATLLFSPKELKDFISLINIKDRSVHTSNEIYYVKKDETIENVFKQIRPNFDNLTENLQTKLLGSPIFVQSLENSNEYILSAITEKKDPTSQVSVNTLWGKVEVICTKQDDNIVINRFNTISRDDKLIANRISKIIQSEFKRIDFVKDDVIKVMFKNFSNNIDRVNFLLSFTDVSSSSILRDPDIKSIKFKFDDNEDLPEVFKDKKGKDLITYFNGKNLAGLNEISDNDFKKVLLLEEIFITYKYDMLNIKNGYYSVKYNFSDALKNKPEKDGIFKSEPFLAMSKQVKALNNIDKFKKDLAKEIESIKMGKIKQFNLM